MHIHDEEIERERERLGASTDPLLTCEIYNRFIVARYYKEYVVLWNPSSPKPLGVRPLGQHHQVVSASFWLDARTKDSTASNSSSRISSIVLLNSNRELRIISLATQSTAEVIAKAQARKVRYTSGDE